jgi:hypothetical protein
LASLLASRQGQGYKGIRPILHSTFCRSRHSGVRHLGHSTFGRSTFDHHTYYNAGVVAVNEKNRRIGSSFASFSNDVLIDKISGSLSSAVLRN